MNFQNAFVAVAALSIFSAGAAVTSEIPLLPGERWWGGGGADGQNQPYGAADSKRIDLRYHGSTSSPLLVSTAGRYVWSEQPFAYQFKGGRLVLESDAGRIEPVQAGSTLKEAYLDAARRHFRFNGVIPPAVFFAKPQWNNWIEIFLHGMDQKAADDYTADLAKSGFPCGIYMMDGGWLSHQGSYEFHAPDFPDPKGLFDRVNAQGWIPLIWTAHFVSPDSREYKRLRYHPKSGGLDYLALRKAPGSHDAAAVRWWSGISAIYDLTRPEANAFFVDTLKAFAAQYGIRGYKFDAGDPHFFREDCRFHDPAAQPVDYTRLYAELAAREFPYHEIRVSWKCGGLPLVTRLGDRAHAWGRSVTHGKGPDAALDHCAQDTVSPQIVTAGLLGCPYSLADMVGGGLEFSFVGRELDPKLFVRSAALQALMPMMQFSLLPGRHLSPENVAHCRRFAELHEEFAPYILDQARRTSRSGEPIVRAMEYEFPHQGFTRPMQQFMLGPKWLVAPVVTPDDAVAVELPAGRWRDDLGAEHVGPKTLRLEQVPLDRLPRFERLDCSEGPAVSAAEAAPPKNPLAPVAGPDAGWTTEGFHSSAGGKDATKFAWWMTDTDLEFKFEVVDTTPCAREKVSGKKDLMNSDRVEVFVSPRVDMTSWYYGAEMDPYGNVLDYRAKFFRQFDNAWSFRTLKMETARRADGYTLRGRISRQELVELGVDPHNFSLGAFRADFKGEGELVAWTSALPQPPGKPDFHRPAMLMRQVLP